MFSLTNCFLLVLLSSSKLCYTKSQSTLRDDLASDGAAVLKAITVAGIIPDVLDPFIPSVAIEATYAKAKQDVKLGNAFPVNKVATAPNITLERIRGTRPSPKINYTVILTDPDAISRQNPNMSEVCHWITLQVPLGKAYQLVTNDTRELEAYLSPGPPPRTGPHRYTMVVLRPKPGSTLEPKAPSTRYHWGYDAPREGIRRWSQENQLEIVGANFFLAQNDVQ